jgi:hypothetical protein
LEVKHLWVWRLFRASHREEFTWRKIPIGRLNADQLWKQIGEHVISTQRFLSDAQEGNPLDVAKACPPDGLNKNMFNGWLCDKGCPVREACANLEGMMEF